jgi:hypothetical protein
MSNFVRRLIPQYAHIKLPLNLYRKFEELAQKLGYDTTLAFFKRFILVALMLCEAEWAGQRIYLDSISITFKKDINEGDSYNEWEELLP